MNHTIFLELNSNMSQRRIASNLNVNRKTVVRKFRFLAAESRIKHAAWLKELEKTPLAKIQFDDLETSEHTKRKPLSVVLAVIPGDRKLLGFQVSRMPARGLLAKSSHYPSHLKKYHPYAKHRTVKGRKAREGGLGELKKGFDPLFSLNHTCAMLRANLNRLNRRTWCTTKTIQGLEDHLALYLEYHNNYLT